MSPQFRLSCWLLFVLGLCGVPALQRFAGPPPQRLARWEKARHWSHVPPRRPEVPLVLGRYPVRNPIDRFILGRLEEEGMTPAAEAPRETLIRRVSLDLVGLPPTPRELADFLHDPSPDAYERVVDRLLASPDYGEHQARYWLDLARYADSNGYESDQKRSIWPYRDWVIHALQNNMPFDQFTIKQIAGDLLPGAARDDQIATGFHRNTAINQDGGADDEECRVAAVVDRVNTTMAVWMGTTLQCAQCHRHPADPFAQRDYFGLYAIFNNTRDCGTKMDPVLQTPTPAQQAERARLQAEIAQAQRDVDMPSPELRDEQAAWEEQHRNLPRWQVLQPVNSFSEHDTVLTKQPDHSLLASKASLDQDAYIVDTSHDLANVVGFRLEVLPDPSAPKDGPGLAEGNFILSEFQVLASDDNAPPTRLLEFRDAHATHEQSALYSARAAIDGNFQVGWGVAPAYGECHSIVFSLKQPTSAKRLRFILTQNFGNRHLIARFRLSATTTPGPLTANRIPDAIADLLRLPAERRSDTQRDVLTNYYRSLAPRLAPQRQRLAALTGQLADLAIDSTLVMAEREELRPTHIHRRGDFRSPSDAVRPATPAILHPLPISESPDRLGLARWLVQRDNPLTARVVMNRLWARCFGHGIVATIDDFGSQGSLPSHPELLDWLAVEFMESGWNLKHMLRLMVTSATYRQASNRAAHERDPHDRLLARQARLRLDAETLRDQTLAACGLLERRVGGPSVFPHQPDGVWNGPYLAERWEASAPPDRQRRSLYTFWKRTAPYPLFALFDAPTREASVACRPRSNTPLQALALLNEKAQLEAASALARRILVEAPDDDRARVDFAFQRCVARSATPREAALLLGLVADNLREYRNDATLARRLLPGEESSGVDRAVWAAWTLAGNVLLNLDEFLTRP